MPKPDPAIVAAIQVAVLAKDYNLAINLLYEHKLTDRCVGCVCEVEGGFNFILTWDHGELKLTTCRPCTEEFALWYVSKSPSRRMFDGALHGGLYRG